VHGVDDLPALARRAQQAGALQLFEVERRIGCADAYTFRDLAGRHPRRSLLHQKPEDRQSVLMRQCGQGGDGLRMLHP
jgi:hypothetical protein